MYSPPSVDRSRVLVIVASVMDVRAKGLADALRPFGWNVIVSPEIQSYLGTVRAFLYLLSRTATQSQLFHKTISQNPPNLIPILLEPMEIPSGPWATAPIIAGVAPAETAQLVTNAASALPMRYVALPSSAAVLSAYQPQAPASAAVYSPRGAQLVAVGGGITLLGFFLPWLSYPRYFNSIGVSLSGWDIVGITNKLSSASYFQSGSGAFFAFGMWILVVIMALNLGAIVPTILGREADAFYRALVAIASIGLVILVIGLLYFVNTINSALGVYQTYFNAGNFIGVGVYVAIGGFVVSVMGGAALRRDPLL